jgi:SAM-dependent methyltransferase
MYVDQAIRWGMIQQHLPPPPLSIFEVGCGEGEFIEHLIAEGYTARGCEPQTGGLSNKAEIRNLVIQASGTAIPLPDDSVDCTVSSDVLEHVQPSDRRRFVQEMLRITKPGGVVVCTVWVRPTLSFRLMGCIYLLRWGKLPAWYIEHITIRPPPLSEIAQLLREGAVLLKVQPYHAAIGHITAAAQHAFFRDNSRACQLTTALSGAASALDFFGAKGSCLYVARKLSPHQVTNTGI